MEFDMMKDPELREWKGKREGLRDDAAPDGRRRIRTIAAACRDAQTRENGRTHKRDDRNKPKDQEERIPDRVAVNGKAGIERRGGGEKLKHWLKPLWRTIAPNRTTEQYGRIMRSTTRHDLNYF